ncbi:Hpt domain-containing protein [Curvibacter sp. HBC61]|uniref:histidine kinase n=1 Tax=Curvibacter cyanobacteriorum TaxID=3026422 RepID=A0ABT5N2K3_9BURK|nr:Hpt domain-containing protein [Curvibacter sp. HBC61]MDD0839751.1 Hpt domain-containing protein [Curvibacter sp. HBC61]
MRPTEAAAPVGPDAADQDLGPLAWVLDELRKSLESSVKALRRFVREAEQSAGSELGAADVSALRLARQQLHQATGALEMVGQPPVALMLRAMEGVAQKLIQSPAQCNEEVIGLIERASFAVSEYLEAVLAGHEVSPVALFPQFRDVQQWLGAERVHPADLWTHDRRLADPALPADIKPLAYSPDVRSRFDHAMLRLVKTGRPAGARAMAQLAAGLADAGSQGSRLFWKVAAGFFEGIALDLVPLDVYVKRVISRVLVQYTALSKGEAAVSDRLFQDLLFYCAQARLTPEHEAPLLRPVREAFELQSHPAADYEARRFGRFDPAVLVQARKRIAAATDTWSALAGGDRNKLRSAVDQFNLVAESLRKLHPASVALGDALQHTAEVTAEQGEVPGPALAMEVATAVLFLQACYQEHDTDEALMAERAQALAGRLQRVLSGQEVGALEPWMEELYRRVSDRQTMGSVVEELRATLTEVEKSLDGFFRQPTDAQGLSEVPAKLSQMRGVLSVLGLDQAAHATMRMRDSVERLMVDEVTDDALRAGTFERLGNSLGALGFLIDMLSYQRSLARKLFVYDEDAGELKFLGGRQRQQYGAPNEAPSSDDFASTDAAPLAPASDFQAALPQAAFEAAPAQPTVEARESALEASAGLDERTAPAWPAPQPAVPEPASAASDADLAEDDLLDVFLEEAREVLATGRAAVQALGDDPGNLTEQTVLRRAFHTLKGSSRMVGLAEFGEAAWALEQLLNAWLAEQKPASPALRQVGAHALSQLARWADDIAAHRADGWRAQPLRELADALRLEDRLLLSDAEPTDVPTAGPTDVPAPPWADLAPATEPQADAVADPLADLPALDLSGFDLEEVPGPQGADSAAASAPAPTPSADGLDLDFEAPAFNLDFGPDPSQTAPSAPLAAPLLDALTEASAEEAGDALLPDGFHLDLPEVAAPAPLADEFQTDFEPTAFLDDEAPGDAVEARGDPADLRVEDIDFAQFEAELQAGLPEADAVDPIEQALEQALNPVEPEPSAASFDAAEAAADASATPPSEAAIEPPLPDGLDLDFGQFEPSLAAAWPGELPDLTLSSPEAPSDPLAEPEPEAEPEAAQAPMSDADAATEALYDAEAALASAAEPAPDTASAADGEPPFDFDLRLEPTPFAGLAPGPVAAPAATATPAAEPTPELTPESAEAEALDDGAEVEPGSGPDTVFAEAIANESIKVIGDLRLSIPLYNVYLNEADEWSRRLQTTLGEWALELHEPVPDNAITYAHSLAGSSATVGFMSLSSLARTLEHALQHVQLQSQGRAQQAEAFVDAADEIRRLLHQFAAGFLKEPQPDVVQALLDILATESDATVAPEPDLLDEPLAQPLSAEDLSVDGLDLADLSDRLEAPASNEPAFEALAEAPPALTTPDALSALAPEHAVDPEAWPEPDSDLASERLADAASDLGDALTPGDAEPASLAEPPSLAPWDLPEADVAPPAAGEALTAAFDDAEAGSDTDRGTDADADADAETDAALTEPLDAAASLADFADEGPVSERDADAVAVAADAEAADATATDALLQQALSPERPNPDTALATAPAAAPRAELEDDIDAVDVIDPDLFPIFEEEALELLPRLGASLRRWQSGGHGDSERPEVLRLLHTLKGSARLAGALRLGDMAHRMESLIEGLGDDGADAAALDGLMARFDAMQASFDALRGFSQQAADAAARVPEEAPSDSPSDADGRDAMAEAAPATPVLHFPPTVQLLPAKALSGQSVRVRSQLLDRLVNQAGEVMISRSRLEARMGQLRGSLSELTGNLDRLRQQLRDIEVQAESQMQSRLALAKDSAAGFDPLEFDRFTRVQELTRMMAESVNDVATVQRNLQRTVEGTEDELIAQARQARELQRDLLRTRMVEFDGVSERLYAIARQSAKETGKQIKLDITGGSIEMDRGVLDRMTPAFEHLLRNAVAHGVESPEQRAAAGKPTAGHITIAVSQSGNDVSVEFADDGAGLNLARIRARAESQGLLSPGQAMSDEDAAQLIFTPGFTTVTEVTELAGRGIGMDVVRTEVNALGGRIETHTRAGEGSQFKLVLPLTTAVTQVVMLRCGQVTVGVPASLVEIVRRVGASELDASYQSGQFDLGVEWVPFFGASALLQMPPSAAEPAARTRPVVIFRSAAQRIAVHVDEVLGNQEVVVKNLGPQLARLPGLAGMSVLASGAVVMIYNPVALATVYGDQIRRCAEALRLAQAAQTPGLGLAPSDGQAAAPAVPLERVAATLAQVPLVLVVDDSITVRRVTQRLLQREGYRVALASDGLQALERLQEERPVVVLSDIEMPRMDGFDLTRNIRHDAAFRDLPIVMITSRIAAKHREHALELGVNHYLGKPYSEEELLSLVRRYAAQAAQDGPDTPDAAEDAQEQAPAAPGLEAAAGGSGLPEPQLAGPTEG